MSPSTAREAITILQGEMEGYYTNARREDYGPGILGPDFLVDGIGEFENITHVEVKNPVGSAILKSNNISGTVYRQGKEIGRKVIRQQHLWSNSTQRSKLGNLNLNASFPQSPINVLGVVDNFDVPINEKPMMEGGIMFGSRNNTNLIFLN